MYMGLYHPSTVTYIGPEMFIAKPWIWLQTLSRFKAFVSVAPDFAFGLCLQKVKDKHMEDVDLSHWETALNGAEPIDTACMEAFSQRFARWGLRAEAITPVYGLAEAGLAVSFSDFHLPALVNEFDREELSEQGRAITGKGRRLPSVGRPMSGLDIEIRDEEDHPVPDGQVGRIMVRGPSISKGYFNDPKATGRAIRNGWLDTGDLGFFRGGHLYIAGRSKDLIIIRGRNYAPQEIEELLRDMGGLRSGCTVAVSSMVEGKGEQLIVLAERDLRTRRKEEDIVVEIKDRIGSGMGLNPYHVQILDPGTLPRTSSGKMRRAEALRMFLEGGLLPPEKMNALKIFREISKSQIALGRFWFRKRLGE
jgi:acyl-CoA synthetase (AMP-forming)/AMP-acid ligase II